MKQFNAAAFLYSQDLSNRKTTTNSSLAERLFLYSQDLSNRKTGMTKVL